MTLPTVPGVYQDAIGDLWKLLDDGRWQYQARRLPFGGLTTAQVDDRSIGAEELGKFMPFPEAQLLPLKRVEAEDELPEIDSWP